MPTHRYFDQVPEFSSSVPVADIPIISFEKLQANVDHESQALFEACREYGLFLLDLRGFHEGEALLNAAETMFDINTMVLTLDKEVLNNYAYKPPKDLLGYKSSGKLKTDDGKLDAMEMYTIGQDDIMGTVPPRQNPEPLEARRKDCQLFFRRAHQAVSVILTRLDKELGLASGTLAALCPLEKPSGTSLRMLLSHPQRAEDYHHITLGGHTDIGIITMLFNVVGGLQMLPANAENVNSNWQYIRPELGCALINMGDTIVEWTGGVLRSPLHRVLAAPGEQANATRQSLAYLIRPDRDGWMSRLRGSDVIPPLAEGEEEETCKVDEWAAGRAKQIMEGKLKPRTTGGRRLKTIKI